MGNWMQGQCLGWWDLFSYCRGNQWIHLEDECWLYLVHDSQHINLVELNALLKGINLVLQWKVTDSSKDWISMCASVDFIVWKGDSVQLSSTWNVKNWNWYSILKLLTMKYRLIINKAVIKSHEVINLLCLDDSSTQGTLYFGKQVDQCWKW